MKIRVFTDGACSGNPGPGGWASCILLDEYNKTISGGEENTTNNRMELLAVVRAIQEASKVVNCSKIEIFSDSAYVVNAIQKKWLAQWQKNNWKTSDKNDVKNKDLWLELIEEMNVCEKWGIEIIFNKVKGHSGNYLNELVDEVARKEVNKIKNKKEV